LGLGGGVVPPHPHPPNPQTPIPNPQYFKDIFDFYKFNIL